MAQTTDELTGVRRGLRSIPRHPPVLRALHLRNSHSRLPQSSAKADQRHASFFEASSSIDWKLPLGRSIVPVVMIDKQLVQFEASE